MSQNPLTALEFDYWYKILPVVATVMLIIGLTVDVKGVTNTLMQLTSIGIIFIGIGEWINHPLQTRVGAGFQTTSYNRINSIAGNAWDILGAAIVTYCARLSPLTSTLQQASGSGADQELR